MEHKEGFHFTYSAAQQQEIESIRKKYLPEEEDKMQLLRRLHQSATKKAQAKAITAGTAGTLILGSGMSLVMTELGALVGMESGLSMLVGGGAGLLGLILVALAYPLYNRAIKKERERIAPEILRLTDELLQ